MRKVVEAVSLGWIQVVANYKDRRDPLPAEGYGTPTLHLFYPSSVDDGAFQPAVDICVSGIENIKKVRDLCQQVIDGEGVKPS